MFQGFAEGKQLLEKLQDQNLYTNNALSFAVCKVCRPKPRSTDMFCVYPWNKHSLCVCVYMSLNGFMELLFYKIVRTFWLVLKASKMPFKG